MNHDEKPVPTLTAADARTLLERLSGEARRRVRRRRATRSAGAGISGVVVGAAVLFGVLPLTRLGGPAPAAPATPAAAAAAASAAGGAAPDNRIAFLGVRAGQQHVYLMNADGSHVRRITSGDGVDWGPAWRPGGKQLAFFRCTAEGPYDCDLYTVRADGGQLHDLLPGPAVTAHPAWSPDGARLAYTQEGPDGVQVFAMNADGSGATQLTHVPGGVLHPVWSPDGATLAFDTPIGSARGRIGRVQVDGSGFRWLLTDGPGRYDVLRTQSWSADGSALVFTRFRIGQDNGVTSDVYTLNLSDGAIDRITADGASEYPSWSSDGGRIAFDAGPTDRHQLFTVNRDGTGRAQLTDDALSHSDAVWSR